MAVQNPTTNYGWALPAIGGDIGTWGGKLNRVFGDDGTESFALGIDGVIGGLQTEVNTLQTEVDALEDRIETVEESGITALYAKVQLSGNQSIPHNTATKVSWDTEVFDEGGVHASGTFTVPADGDGLWHVHAACTGESFASGDDSTAWLVQIRHNGTAVAQGRSPHSNDGFSSSSGDVTVQCATILDLEVGDTLEVYVTQADPGGGGAENLKSGVGTFFEAVRLAPGDA